MLLHWAMVQYRSSMLHSAELLLFYCFTVLFTRKSTYCCGLTVDLSSPLQRPESITISASDLTGKTFNLPLNGVLARIFQHEYDHLEVCQASLHGLFRGVGPHYCRIVPCSMQLPAINYRTIARAYRESQFRAHIHTSAWQLSNDILDH